MTIDFRGWIISPQSDGFESIELGFGGIAKYLIYKDNMIAGFAFAVSGVEQAIDTTLTDKKLGELAENKIKQWLSEDLVSDRSENTFIFVNGEFEEEPNAKWWVKTL